MLGLRIAGIVQDSIVDGPGLRTTVFLQGCGRNCKGCHNPQTHDYSGGSLLSLLGILQKITTSVSKNVTFSGGEPFDQAKNLTNLAIVLKVYDFHIMAYTGYTWEELIADEEKLALLQYVDILVDGPFIEEQKTTVACYKGSRNQRVIDVPESLANGVVVLSPYDR